MNTDTLRGSNSKIISDSEVDELFRHITVSAPMEVTLTDPDNLLEARDTFIADEGMEHPNYTYSTLDAFTGCPNDILDKALMELLAVIPEEEAIFYREYIEEYKRKYRLLELMKAIRHTNGEEKLRLSEEFMTLNIEQYGAPDEQTFHSLLAETLSKIDDKSLSPEAQIIRHELSNMTPDGVDSSAEISRFIPSEATQAWMQEVAEALCGRWLDYLPDGDTITPEQFKDCAEMILKDVGKSAEGWRVELANTTDMKVIAIDRLIKISNKRGPFTRQEVIDLIGHELGVHFLRSISGEDKRLRLLRLGLPGYYDDEEGLGRVMGMSLARKYRGSGGEHYISAGFAYFEHKNFREVYELNWRIKLLQLLEDDEKPTEEKILQAKNYAVRNTRRIFRGTDELPWFKDLSYYNGANDVWQYLETINGDDLQLALFLQGKVSISKRHQRVMLEAADRGA